MVITVVVLKILISVYQKNIMIDKDAFFSLLFMFIIIII